MRFLSLDEQMFGYQTRWKLCSGTGANTVDLNNTFGLAVEITSPTQFPNRLNNESLVYPL